jgi:aryl-alcohol dehydrogenase-like predicted oxidoreductase
MSSDPAHPSTPLDVSRIVLGCVALSTLPTRAAAFRLLESAVASGITHFDTARVYGQGFSERVLGEFLASHSSSLRVTTKLGSPDGRLATLPTRIALPLNWLRNRLRRPTAQNTPTRSLLLPPLPRITRAHVAASIEASLRCLCRSRIDVFLLHEALPCQLDHTARDLIVRLQAEGTIGAFGIGTARRTIEQYYTDDPLCTVLQYDVTPGQPCNVLTSFAGKTHIHHSIFRPPLSAPRSETLRLALGANPSGRVVFGTRSVNHLRHNLGLNA